MAVYTLFNGITAQNTPSHVVPIITGIAPSGPYNPDNPPTQQTFHLVVTATAGNASGTANVLGSNDGINWVAVGSAVTASSTYLVAQAAATTNVSYKYYGAYLSAISGTGASATLLMSA